jgi:hypothetical protein
VMVRLSLCGEPLLGTVCTTAQCDDEQRCDVSSEWDAVSACPKNRRHVCISCVSRCFTADM